MLARKGQGVWVVLNLNYLRCIWSGNELLFHLQDCSFSVVCILCFVRELESVVIPHRVVFVFLVVGRVLHFFVQMVMAAMHYYLCCRISISKMWVA